MNSLRGYVLYVHIYNILFITKYSFIDHLKAPEIGLQKFVEAGLKLNV